MFAFIYSKYLLFTSLEMAAVLKKSQKKAVLYSRPDEVCQSLVVSMGHILLAAG